MKCNSIDEVINAINKIGEEREELSFGIDGAVIKVNNLELREKIGVNFKAPKWAIAYKYPHERKETILKDIICQVGRTRCNNSNGNIRASESCRFYYIKNYLT